MAEDKKAFVVYADWESQFDLLSDEEAGKLIKHIFSYVNDKNPEFDKNDRLLNMAFEPIKKQLKRDLRKYEIIKEKRAEAGRKSAELRAQQSQQMSTSVDFVEHNSTNTNKAQQSSTNPTVTDKVIDTGKVTVTGTDIVTDTVKDTVTVTEREINNTGDPPTQKFSQSFSKQPIETLKKKCSGYSEWLTVIAKKNSLTMLGVLEWLDAFELNLLGQGKTEESESEFKNYFNSWVTSEIRKGRSPTVKNESKDAPKKTVEQIAQEVIIKKYGNRAYEG